MIRKLLMVAAVTIVPVGAIVATGSIAGAAVTETGTAKCGAVVGTLTFSTPLTTAGVPVAPGATFTETTTVAATLTKCTASKVGVKLTKGVVAGTVKLVTNNTLGTTTVQAATCGSLQGVNAVTASLKTTWTATVNNVATAITPTTSKWKNDKGGQTTVTTTAYGTFGLPGATGGTLAGSGSFLGTNSGKSDSTFARTKTSTGGIAIACGGTGLASIGITTWSTSATVNTPAAGGPSASFA